MPVVISEEQCRGLVASARAAVAKAFLTSPGGTSYGAAVLTLSGKVYGAGQYSSFNHVTNVHAEQAALVIAAMSDDPDVVALAVASSGSDAVTRPCGVCCQVMDEHRRRTGRDFEVLMAHSVGGGYDRTTVSGLLRYPWVANSLARVSKSCGKEVLRPDTLSAQAVPADRARVGDHVQLSCGAIAMVWDGALGDGKTLVKVKYVRDSSGGYRKLAHSFSEPLLYQAELCAAGLQRPTVAGFHAAVYSGHEVAKAIPAPAAGSGGCQIPVDLSRLLEQVGIDVAAIRVTGSRSIGLEYEGSDWDLIVPVEPAEIVDVRKGLFGELSAQRIAIPESSGSWKALHKIFPGGVDAIKRDRRFMETFWIGGASVALIFVPREGSGPLLAADCQPLGRACLYGEVIEAVRSPFKRSEYEIETVEHGNVRVACYTKLGNLVRVGDRLAVRGWLVHQGGAKLLIQMLAVPDNIVWHH
jgi:cytidine deaminase